MTASACPDVIPHSTTSMVTGKLMSSTLHEQNMSSLKLEANSSRYL
jgi:hypothetical protein